MSVNYSEPLPDTISVTNQETFRTQFIQQKTARFRKEVVSFLLSRKRENDFIDLDQFNRKYVSDMKVTSQIVENVSNELKALGWYPVLGFGDTGLYILSTEEKPDNIY